VEIGRRAVQPDLVQPFRMIASEVTIQARVELQHVSILWQAEVFVLDRVPQPFHEDVI
jgi:hypothetical protein